MPARFASTIAMLQDRSPWLVSRGRSICGVASGNSASAPSTTNFSSAVVISAASSDFMVILSGFFCDVGGTAAIIADPLLWLQRRKSQAFIQALIWIDVDRPAQSVTVSRGFRTAFTSDAIRAASAARPDAARPSWHRIAIFPASHRSGQAVR